MKNDPPEIKSHKWKMVRPTDTVYAAKTEGGVNLPLATFENYNTCLKCSSLYFRIHFHALPFLVHVIVVNFNYLLLKTLSMFNRFIRLILLRFFILFFKILVKNSMFLGTIP